MLVIYAALLWALCCPASPGHLCSLHKAFTGPRDVWDISLGMISSFDIAKYGLSKNTVQKYNPKIQSNIDGNGVNIA